jgi:hypothetical protein
MGARDRSISRAPRPAMERATAPRENLAFHPSEGSRRAVSIRMKAEARASLRTAVSANTAGAIAHAGSQGHAVRRAPAVSQALVVSPAHGVNQVLASLALAVESRTSVSLEAAKSIGRSRVRPPRLHPHRSPTSSRHRVRRARARTARTSCGLPHQPTIRLAVARNSRYAGSLRTIEASRHASGFQTMNGVAGAGPTAGAVGCAVRVTRRAPALSDEE